MNKYILTSVLGLASLAAAGQVLNTEVNVERTVAPVQRAATRLAEVTPEILTPKTDRSSLPLTEYTTAVSLTPTFHALDAAPYPAMPGVTPYRGYIAAGYFPAYNLGVAAGYRILNTARTTLEASAQFNGSSYGQDDHTASNNTVDVNVDLGQRVGHSSLFKASGHFGYSALGLPVEKDNKRNLTRGGLGLQWWSTVGALTYHITGELDHFAVGGDVPVTSYVNAAQNLYGLNLGGLATFGAERRGWAGLEVSFRNLHTMRGMNILSVTALERESANDGFLRLTPHVGFHPGRVTVRLGANVDIRTAGAASDIEVSPEAMLDWNPSSSVAVFATFSGGRNFNTLAREYAYSAFAPGIYAGGAYDVPVDARAGINVGPFAGVSVGLWAGYSSAQDVAMPVLLDGLSTFSPCDVKGWRLGVDARWQFRNLFDLHAAATLRPSDKPDAGYYRDIDRARYIIETGVTVTPIPRLSVTLDYEFRGGRAYYACVTAPSITALCHPTGAVSDLSLGASYAISPAFSVYLRGENLMGRRPLDLPGLQRQGVHGLAGIELKF